MRARVEDGILITSILDEGTGIPKAIVNDIKEKHISTQLTVKGMGLQLVYLLVLEHGGQIRFNQKVDGLMGVVVEIGKE